MLPAKIARPVTFILIILYFGSCTTTYEVTRRSELTMPDDLGELTVTANDNKEYTMEHYRLEDSALVYTGTILVDNKQVLSSGKLKLSNIKKIEAYEGSLGRTILIVGAAAAVIITFCVFLDHENGLKNDVVIKYPGGGCSNGGGGGCNDISSKFLPEDSNKPLAAGFADVIDQYLPSGDRMYLEIINRGIVYHFTVTNYVDRFQIEALEETPDNMNSSNTVIIDLGNQEY